MVTGLVRKIRRPPLRYHGGKWLLAPWIISHFAKHRTYVEPFGGGASVLLRKPRSYAEVYNDLDGELVNVFRVLQDPASAERLRQILTVTPFARAEFERSYERSREPIEWARRTITRSLMGFGSDGVNDARRTGFRANSSRSGTTPALDWMNYPKEIAAVVERMRGVVIEQRDAFEVIAQHDGEQTLFYVDPPYVHSARAPIKNSARKNYRFEMTDEEHASLATVLRSVRGMVILSGYDCQQYEDLYGDWFRIERAAFADGARPRTEVLWLSPNAHASAPINMQFTSGEIA